MAGGKTAALALLSKTAPPSLSSLCHSEMGETLCRSPGDTYNRCIFMRCQRFSSLIVVAAGLIGVSSSRRSAKFGSSAGHISLCPPSSQSMTYASAEIALAPHYCARHTLPGADAIADLEFKHDCAPCDTLAGALAPPAAPVQCARERQQARALLAALRGVAPLESCENRFREADTRRDRQSGRQSYSSWRRKETNPHIGLICTGPSRQNPL